VPNGCDVCLSGDDNVDANSNTYPDACEESAIINVKTVSGTLWRGYHVDTYTAHSIGNTLTGTIPGAEYRSYFVFDLSDISASVVLDVKLRLELERYVSSDASETMSVWDVTTALDTVQNSNGLFIWDDLGFGDSYGSSAVDAGDVGSVTVTTLNNNARVDVLQALGGDFGVGVKLNGVSESRDENLRFSSGTEARTHQLEILYYP